MFIFVNIFQKSEPQFVGIRDIEAPERFLRKMHFIYPGLNGRSQFIGHLQDVDNAKGSSAAILTVSWSLAFTIFITKMF